MENSRLKGKWMVGARQFSNQSITSLEVTGRCGPTKRKSKPEKDHIVWRPKLVSRKFRAQNGHTVRVRRYSFKRFVDIPFTCFPGYHRKIPIQSLHPLCKINQRRVSTRRIIGFIAKLFIISN